MKFLIFIFVVTPYFANAGISVFYKPILVELDNKPLAGVKVQVYYYKYNNETKKIEGEILKEESITSRDGRIGVSSSIGHYPYFIRVEEKGFNLFTNYYHDLPTVYTKRKKDNEFIYSEYYKVSLKRTKETYSAKKSDSNIIISKKEFEDYEKKETQDYINNYIYNPKKDIYCLVSNIQPSFSSILLKYDRQSVLTILNEKITDRGTYEIFLSLNQTIDKTKRKYQLNITDKYQNTLVLNKEMYLEPSEAYHIKGEYSVEEGSGNIEFNAISIEECLCENVEIKYLLLLYNSERLKIEAESYLYTLVQKNKNIVSYLESFGNHTKRDKSWLEEEYIELLNNKPIYGRSPINKNDIDDYSTFFPNGNNKQKIKDLLEKRRSEQAKLINSDLVNELFIQYFPNGEYARKIKNEEEEQQRIAKQQRKEELEREKQQRITEQQRKEELEREKQQRIAEQQRKEELEREKQKIICECKIISVEEIQNNGGSTTYKFIVSVENNDGDTYHNYSKWIEHDWELQNFYLWTEPGFPKDYVYYREAKTVKEAIKVIIDKNIKYKKRWGYPCTKIYWLN